jgi:beta-N-acetylhexosaminidase
MRALSGTLTARADAAIRAGSDVALHCNGDLAEMEAVAAGVPMLAGKARERFLHAIRLIERADPFDVARAEACLSQALAIGLRRTESV